MTTVLCTLYNSLYLDKGLVLYDSLSECAKDFKLYVLCMDDKCYDVLTDLTQEHHIPVRLSDFEDGDAELLEAKANRPMGEYCWTCSSSFIRYVLNHFNEESCTYIDADMYFYKDPQVLVDEMIEAKKSVMVVPHWFHNDNIHLAKTVGQFCVEFNTFLNNPESLDVLDYWRSRCLEKCSNVGDGIHWGDQKYLEELVSKFQCIHISTNRGAGLAPWNIGQYKCGEDRTISLDEIRFYDIVFFHFQGITFLDKKHVDISYKGEMDNVFYYLYVGYLNLIKKKKDLLLSLGIDTYFNAHPGVYNKFNLLKKIPLIGVLFKWKRLFIDREKIVIRIS